MSRPPTSLIVSPGAVCAERVKVYCRRGWRDMAGLGCWFLDMREAGTAVVLSVLWPNKAVDEEI